MDRRSLALGILIIGCTATLAADAVNDPAKEATPSSIEAEPIAGQLDVLQATAVQLNTKIEQGRPEPVGYLWKIVQGEGAQLFSADQPTAVFLGPQLDDGVRIFLVELTVRYQSEEPSRSRMQILVHAKPPGDAQAGAASAPPQPDPDDTAWLDDFYRDARARDAEKKSQTPVLVPGYSSGPRTSIGIYGRPGGWGVGMGFTFRMSYPIAVPVQVPPPGQSLEPGQGRYYPPRPVPYDEMVTTFPAAISERYLPQDNPFHGTTLPSYSSSFARSPGQTSHPKLVESGFGTDPIGW